MTSLELSRTRDYLEEHRRMIIGRSVAAAIAGAVPVPLLEEWLSSSIQRGTIRRIADARGIDLDDAAVRAIADGPARPPEWTEIAGGGLAYRLLTRSWRRVVIAYLAVRRARAAGRAFTVATLFDHYCARMHVGLGLDAGSGAELRALIDRAIEETPGGLSRRMFRRGLVAAGRATLRAPVDLIDLASGGGLTRLLSRGEEVEAVDEVDVALEQQLAEKKSFLARSAAAIELQLSVDANPYLDHLLDAFEELWRERQPGSS